MDGVLVERSGTFVVRVVEDRNKYDREDGLDVKGEEK